jgi:hypothetical protein
MKVRRTLTAIAACGLMSFALIAGSAQAAKNPPKPKNYTYCVSNGLESECFPAPFEVFHKTLTWSFEGTTGTYTAANKNYVFKENGGPDELVGTRSHDVISGTLRENGKNTEFTFTLTPS